MWKIDQPNFYDSDLYRIKPEPRTRPMTRGEVLYMVTTTPAMVLRVIGGPMSWLYPSQSIDFDTEYEYAIIDKTGEPIDGWKRFEVTE